MFTPNGKVLYVGVEGGMRPVDTATGKVGPLITVPEPDMAVMAPNGAVLYVESAMRGTVTPVDTATNEALAPIEAGVTPDVIAITPDGKTLYVGSQDTTVVVPVTTATGTVGQPIPVGGIPIDMAVAPDDKTLYVATGGLGTVTPISTATNQPGVPIQLGGLAAQLALTPDGRTLYVVRLIERPGALASAIIPIRTASDHVLAAIQIERGQWSTLLRIEMGPEGFEVYALVPRPFRQGKLIPISTATNKPGRAIPVPGPVWVGFSQS